MKLNHALYGCGALAFLIVLAVVFSAPKACPPASIGSPPPSSGTDVSAYGLTETEKQRCYNWLEADLQACPYVLQWLQRNNKFEDERTGYQPTEEELAERKVVQTKTLFCRLAPKDHLSFTSRAQFMKDYAPEPGAIAPQAAAEGEHEHEHAAPALNCRACLECPVCPKPKPAAPAPPPPVAASGPVSRSGGRVTRVPGPGDVAPSTERRIISFGLYGGNPRYTTGALRNAELVPSVMPGWIMRVYHDDSVPGDILNRLRELGCEMIRMTDIKGGIAGMFWRFLVADDPTVDRYIIRDSDSRLSAREALCVQEWIDSGKGFHILRDHPSHSNYVVSGGIWGGRKNAELKLGEKMARHRNKDAYVEDMNFLRDQIYPIMVKDLFAHDSFSCSACADKANNAGCNYGSFPESHPFPAPRVNALHCGQVFDAQDRGRAGDENIIRNSVAPAVCTRPYPKP